MEKGFPGIFLGLQERYANFTNFETQNSLRKVRSARTFPPFPSDGYRHFTEIPKNSEIPIPKCKTKKTDYTDTEVKKYRFSHFGIEARSIETVEKIAHNRLGHVGLDP